MIQKPENMITAEKRIRMLIAGYPGIGKSTLALSAPKPLHIDCDFGVDRVEPQYRKDFIPAASRPYAITLPSGKLEPFIAHQDSLYCDTRDSLQRRPVVVEPHRKGSSASGGKSASGRYHTVRKGETLSKIAARYGLSVSQLKKLNGLKRDQIRVGQKLKVKA